MLALIAGRGDLPLRIASVARPAVILELEDGAAGMPGAKHFRIEHLGSLMSDLGRRGVTEICFAGSVRRPKVDPTAIDDDTMPLVPRILDAIRSGDDTALRTILGLFEERGFKIRAAHELDPTLLPKPGVQTRAQPSERDQDDARRAAAVVAALGGADVGQACCVSAGQALAVEALWGTDWMLASLAEGRRPRADPSGGLLFKAPKPDQDRRVDLPTIGPGTVSGAAAAELHGVVIEAGGVMVMDFDRTLAAADEAGLFLWVREE